MLCKKQKGQILLIVILVVIVALTIGLSLISRSIITLKSSTEEAESQKALTAAEAGIERAIQGGTPVNVSSADVGNKSGYTTNVYSVNGVEFLMNGGNSIPKDEGADLWLSTYSSDAASNYGSPLWTGDLSIYWGNDSAACDNPALEIIIVSGSKNNPISKKYAYDPCPARRSGNNFANPSTPSGGKTINNKTFIYEATVNISAASPGLIARIIPIYGNTTVGIVGSSSFPLQGYKIDSTGTSGQANRKITVFKGWPQAYLPYLSYGLFVAN